MDCILNPADLQAAAESIADLLVWSMLGAAVFGYLLADPLAPVRVLAKAARFYRLTRR